jgi:leucyl aminopeptidase
VSTDTVLVRTPRLQVVPAVLEDPEALGAVAAGRVETVGIPVVESPDGPAVAPGVPASVSLGAGGPAVGTALDAARANQRGFKAKVGETLAVLGSDATPTVVFAGCGRLEAIGVDAFRRAGAAFVRAAGTSGTAVFVLPSALADRAGSAGQAVTQAVAEGAVLAAYRFVAHKSEADGNGHEDGRIGRLVVAADLTPPSVADGIRRAVTVTDAVCLARDLVNEPPSSMTPSRLARAAEEYVAGQPGVTLEVWDEARIAGERLGGLLGVARGSAEPPRLLWASYAPSDPVDVNGHVPHVVLVGKGITFDSGGLSLKSADGMVAMKTDMSGAAAVLSTVAACGALGVRVRVTAIAPTTENMPGGRATKPGDVLTIRNGRTIEVLNTDAEGRLVLADALALASELKPDAVIDLATLTGACVVALGSSIAGLFGTNKDLLDQVKVAAEHAGESVWPLPLPEDYRSHIDSEVADMKNIGKPGQAGAIAAALLLARFVEGVPWAHLDIAGPARAEDDSGVVVRGGTGFGVRTLLNLLEEFHPTA